MSDYFNICIAEKHCGKLKSIGEDLAADFILELVNRHRSLERENKDLISEARYWKRNHVNEIK